MKNNNTFYSNAALLKKAKIAGLMILVIFVIIQAAKIIYQTPVFTGRVLNSVDGKPVKDAVVTAIWWKSSRSGLKPFYSISTISGEKGEYSIPKCTRIYGSRLFSLDPYFYVSLGVMHPLYDGIDSMYNLVWEEKNSQTGKTNFKGEKLPNGAINYDMVLDGIKEKYLLKFASTEINKNEINRIVRTWNPAGFLVHLENFINGWYWNILKKQKNISVDISETFNIWEEIAREFDNMNKADSGRKPGGKNYYEKAYKARIEILTNLGRQK